MFCSFGIVISFGFTVFTIVKSPSLHCFIVVLLVIVFVDAIL